MARNRNSARRSGIAAALLCAGAASLVALPSAGFALSALNSETVSLAARGSFASFTPASVDPRLAKLVAEQGSDRGRMMRFTPAGSPNRPNRSVTVAVRVDEDTARAISVRSVLAAAKDQPTTAALRITPTQYDLGVSVGYQSFAQPAAPVLSKTLSDAAIPDLASFKPAPTAKGKPSRFSGRIALEEADKTGRSPRSYESLGDQTVDVGGSYSVTKNLNVTAGVRYSQDRDRLDPLTNGKQDSQAVYVGTQFRF